MIRGDSLTRRLRRVASISLTERGSLYVVYDDSDDVRPVIFEELMWEVFGVNGDVWNRMIDEAEIKRLENAAALMADRGEELSESNKVYLAELRKRVGRSE